MNTTLKLSKINSADIDLADSRFTLSPCPSSPWEETNDNDLNTQILLHPPLVLRESDGKFIVISGKGIIQRAVHAQHKQIHAVIVQSLEATNKDVFKWLLQHKQLEGGLSDIEQAVLLEKISSVCSQKEILDFLPMMGLKQNFHLVSELISLLALPSISQVALHKGLLSKRSAKKLLHFADKDQKIITRIILNFQLGGSKQQQLIDTLSDLCKREKTSAENMIMAWENQEKEKQHNGPQKGNALLKWLKLKRTPLSAQAESNFQAFCRQLGLPDGIHVEHTTSFEDDQVLLRITYRSQHHLARHWPELKALLAKRN